MIFCALAEPVEGSAAAPNHQRSTLSFWIVKTLLLAGEFSFINFYNEFEGDNHAFEGNRLV